MVRRNKKPGTGRGPGTQRRPRCVTSGCRSGVHGSADVRRSCRSRRRPRPSPVRAAAPEERFPWRTAASSRVQRRDGAFPIGPGNQRRDNGRARRDRIRRRPAQLVSVFAGQTGRGGAPGRTTRSNPGRSRTTGF